MYSQHIFLLPFKIKTRLPRPFSLLHTQMDKKGWRRNVMNQIKTPSDFNEWIYFFDFAHEAIFDMGDVGNPILGQYEIPLVAEDSEFLIYNNGKEEPIRLNIQKITLDIYCGKAGILGFHLSNKHTRDFETIRIINERGRRFFPQFLVGEQTGLTATAKQNILADKIELKLAHLNKPVESIGPDDFLSFDQLEGLQKNPPLLPKYVCALLPPEWASEHLLPVPFRPAIEIAPIVDDRMFVMCWYENDELCASLNKYDAENERFGYYDNDDWYQFLFIDEKGPSIGNPLMKRDLLKKHTYDRWVHRLEGGAISTQLYGMSRYSFVVLTNKEGSFLPMQHFGSMYYRLVLLCLAQRVLVLEFSDKIGSIVNKEKSPASMLKDAMRLNKDYLRFINNIYYREITPQEQGIELYDQIHAMMRIDRDAEDLKKEVQELHNLIAQEENDRQSQTINTLTTISATLVVPALLIGYYGINVLPQASENQPILALYLVLTCILTAIFALLAFMKMDQNRMGRRNFYLGLLLLVVIFSVWLPFRYQDQKQEKDSDPALIETNTLLRQQIQQQQQLDSLLRKLPAAVEPIPNSSSSK